ncbi:MAG: translation initiation factor IF-2 subunit beta [Halobacteriaceae archaeon]
MDYDQALDRAHERLPERPAADETRLSVPDAAAQVDGAFTRFTNVVSVADALSREAEHLHRFVQRELGTNGQFDGQRARYNGSFDGPDFDAAVERYVAEFVTCSECGLPDTNLVTEDGVDMLRCEACGAFRPVEKQSAATGGSEDGPEIEEGTTYEVRITGTGRKGDGVAERGRYTIFVSGAREGDTVDALIESVSGTLAFGRVV